MATGSNIPSAKNKLYCEYYYTLPHLCAIDEEVSAPMDMGLSCWSQQISS